MAYTYINLMKDIDRGQQHPVYFFYGPEEFRKEKAVQALIDKLVPRELRDFNLDILYGKETDASQIIERMTSSPMMGQGRVVVLRNIDKMKTLSKKKLLEYLKAHYGKKKSAEYLHGSVGQNCLIMISPDLDPSDKFYKSYQEFYRAKRIYDQMRKFFKDLERVSFCVVFNALKKDDLLKWAESQVKQQGKSIDPEAAELLFDTLGDDLIALNNEIEKLAIFVGDRPTIGPQDVENVVGEMRVRTVMKLCEAVAVSDVKEAMSLLGHLLHAGVDHSYVTNKLRERVVKLSKNWPRRRNRGSSRQAFTGGSVRREYGQIGSGPGLNFDEKMFEEMFIQLYEADLKMKSGDQKPKAALTQLILSSVQTWQELTRCSKPMWTFRRARSTGRFWFER